MSLKTRILVAVFAALVGGGCGGGASLLEQGKPVDTGRREFDRYFERVAELRDQVEALDSDMFQLRERLVEEMNLDVDVAIGDLLEATRKQVGKAKDYGTTLSLQLTPQPKVIIDRGKIEAGDEEENLFVAIEQSAERAMDEFKSYSQLLEVASELEQQRSSLAERIDKLPSRYQNKKGLIEDEIVAAGRVIERAENKLLRDTRTLGHFLVGLVEAVDTGALESQVAKCDEAISFFEKNKSKKKKPRRRRGPRRTRPPPPPPSGGDFEM